MIKIEITTNILVLKVAHKEYQRKNYTSSVGKEGEVVFLSQQQTYMEFHKTLISVFTIRYSLLCYIVHSGRSPC